MVAIFGGFINLIAYQIDLDDRKKFDYMLEYSGPKMETSKILE
jgi:hypothetical protein